MTLEPQPPGGPEPRYNGSGDRRMDAAAGYCRPGSIEEAIALKSRFDGAAVFLAGGTDLMLRLPRPFRGLLIDLRATGLDRVSLEGDALHIGAMVTAHRLAADPFFRRRAPLLAAAALQLGSPQIRSCATIGGNAVNASPAADLPCALAALEATALLRGPDGERRLPVLALATGPGRTVCASDELLVGFEVPLKDVRSAFEKLGLREAQAIAVSSVAVAASFQAGGRISRLVVACGSVAPRIVRAASVEQALVDVRPDRLSIEEASRLVLRDISPISDVRGSADYRRVATVGILRRALERVMPCS